MMTPNSSEFKNPTQDVPSSTTEATKLINALTDFIPTYLSPSGLLAKEKDKSGKPGIYETVIESENFFLEHPKSFTNDESRIAFIINKLSGSSRKWGISLLVDNTIKNLSYEKFKKLLLENFDTVNDIKQKYMIIDKLFKLKQNQLGNAADYTIEFRRLALRLGWPDEVYIDLIGKGLLDKVREEYSKIDRPETLFDASNSIIAIDKKCYLESCLRNRNNNFKKRGFEYNKHNHFHKRNKKRKSDQDILSANYTPNISNKLFTTFTIQANNKEISTNILIDSGSARSFLCKNFINANKIPITGLTTSMNIQLPNGKSMLIKQTTKPVGLKFLDHSETFEFCVAPLQLQGINGILGRDWLSIHNPYINYKSNKIYFLEKNCLNHCPSCKGNKFVFHSNNLTASMLTEPLEPIIADNISEGDFYDHEICAAMPSVKNENEDSNLKIINQYYPDLKIAFEKKEADKLPPHREYDMSIDLIPGGQLFYGPIYSLTVKEMEALKTYLKENLEKGFIRKSTSPAGAPILFVKKRDGSLRLCVDYKRLNAITIRNSYPIPRLHDLIETFQGAEIFSRLDLRSAYNLIRIRQGHEYLTAFRTPLGHYEYLVIPFGLRNAPSVFQRFIQDIFSDIIGVYIQVYLDDIIIYSKNMETHIQHVRIVLTRLIKNGLFAKLQKCEFHVESTTFLGFTVSAKGLEMDKDKLNSILEWPRPTSQKELQSFLGLCNFYRKFIKNFANLMEPLRILLKKDTRFNWNNEADKAFINLKDSFRKNDILIFPNPEKEFIVETDASDYAIGCVLSQVSELDNLVHPVAFYSRSLKQAEVNYSIYDKELLAIISAFEVWRHHLEGAKFPVQVLTDHKNLLYLRKPQRLSQRQVRWSLFLSRFDFRISYRPGEMGGKPDALSRRPDYKKNFKVTDQPIVPAEVICCSTQENILTLFDAQKRDKFCQDSLNKIKDSSNKIKSSLFSLKEGILHFQNRIIVPSSLKSKLLNKFHDEPLSGHQGFNRTLERLSRHYWWPNMKKDILNYVRSCEICNKNKVRRHKPYGKIQPLPIPSKPWEIIGVDFIVQLPSSQDCTCIMVVADHLTKMVHLIPCSDVPTADLTAKLLLFNVFRYHGFPRLIISDHGSQFSSVFWTSLCSALRIKPRLATAHHQQTNGQVERANSVIEQYLRCYCSTAQNEWCYYLPFCEFAYNNSLHSSTGVTPFYANYGFHPQDTIDSPPILLKDSASSLTRNWNAHFEALKKHLKVAKEQFKKYGDNKNSNGPLLKVNDKVYLKRYYFTNELSKKLSSQFLGPFRILEVRERMNYRLELPENLHLHPVFHISQLEPFIERNPNLVNHQ